MKTPDEIKKGLECCLKLKTNCSLCPYAPAIDGDCMNGLVPDALAYIQQLERERDAAVADMTELRRGSEYCMFCKYLSEGGECTRPILEGRAMCWQWRGPEVE